MRKKSYKIEPSNEELIELVQEQAAELGQTPLVKEFTYSKLASNRYGSWQTFLEQAGLNRRIAKRRISDEELIRLVQIQAAELGQTPIAREFVHYGTAIQRYGTWTAFVKSADLDPRRSKPNISDEKLIELVTERAAELGQTPTIKEFAYSKLAICNYGSWKTFLEEAGLEMRKAKKRISKEELIALVKNQAAESGKTPTTNEFAHHGTAIRRYGTWTAFLKSAGLEPRKSKQPISDEELIQRVREKATELKRVPSRQEFKQVGLAVKRYGAWDAFLVEAGLKRKPKKPKSFRSWLRGKYCQ